MSDLTHLRNADTWLLWSGETLAATAILLVVVMLIRRPVAHFFGAQLSYLLWLIPLARLFLPAFSQTVIVEAPAIRWDDGLTAAISNGDSPRVTNQGAGASDPITGSVGWLDANLWPALMTLWLGGAAIFIIVQLAIYLQHRREILVDARELQRIDDIRIVEVAGIEGPFAFGILRRFIAVPADFALSYTDTEQRLALRHELAHHRAHDLWANFAALLLLALHWFNPLAWLAYRYFRFDQEAACDARVLATADASERAHYSRLIARAATGRTLALGSPLTPKNKLKERLILMNQKPKSRMRRAVGSAAMLGGTAAALALTATVSYAYVVKPAEEVAVAPSAAAAPVTIAAQQSEAPEAPESRETPDIFVSDNVSVIALGDHAPADGETAAPKFRIILSDSDIIREQIAALRGKGQVVGGNAIIIRQQAKAETDAQISASEARAITAQALADIDFDALIPDITISRDCSNGENTQNIVTKTKDGRTVIMVRICDNAKRAEARNAALERLHEARDEIYAESDILPDIREKILKSLGRQIRNFEASEP